MTETAADEQDLAKALDSVADAASSLDGTSSLNSGSHSDDHGSGDELPPIVPPNSPVAPSIADPALPVSPSSSVITTLHDDRNENTAYSSPSSMSSTTDSGPLADIKKDALTELRPLVDKLSVSAEEKFDTYLLLIRSTDDASLIGPAHEAAKSIADEARRAEALLDIIKEIDYLSRQDKPAGN